MSVKSWQGVNEPPKPIINYLCREVVNSRKAVNKIYAAKANLNSVQLQMKGQLAQVTFLLASPYFIWRKTSQFLEEGTCKQCLWKLKVRIAGALSSSTDVMKAMQQLVSNHFIIFSHHIACFYGSRILIEKSGETSWDPENNDGDVTRDDEGSICKLFRNSNCSLTVVKDLAVPFSYASSSTLYPRQRVSQWVIVSDCNLLA